MFFSVYRPFAFVGYWRGSTPTIGQYISIEHDTYLVVSVDSVNGRITVD